MPGLLFIAVNFVIMFLFFVIRQVFPLFLAIINVLFGVVLSCVCCSLLNAAIKLDSTSENFQISWKSKVKGKIENKMLLSCRCCLSFPIDQFGWYTKASFLIFWDTVFEQVANLLMNFGRDQVKM